MILRAALIAGMCFVAAPTMCSDYKKSNTFTEMFSITSCSAGFFVGTTPFLLVQAFKKVIHHTAPPYFTMSCLACSVASSLAFYAMGNMSRMKNPNNQNTKKLGESFLGGFLTGFAGPLLTLWIVNRI